MSEFGHTCLALKISTNSFCQPAHVCCKEEEEKKTMTIAKLFALHESAIKKEL